MAKQQPVRRNAPTNRPDSTRPAANSPAPSRQPVRMPREGNNKGFFSFRGDSLLFQRRHFMVMLIGVALIFLGLALMSGGKQPDANTWDPNIIYNFRIVTLAPICILAGLAMQIYAIFLPTPQVEADNNTSEA